MKIALIGTGKIIEEALYAMTSVKSIEKTAIWARPHSLNKAQTLAKCYDIPEIYTDYEELLEKDVADTVYIGLVNSVHYSYARQALLHGKNVILEKPLTGFEDEAENLQRIAREKKLCIMEAVTILHNDVFYEMKKNLDKIGPVRMFLANYSQYSSRYDQYLADVITHSFDPAYYGGALYDINVYNIHYCVGLFGSPKKVTYYPNLGENGIDTSGTLVMQYDGFSAVCTGAKDSDSPGFVSVQGEKGYMHIKGKPNIASELTTVYANPSAKEKVKDEAGAMVRAAITEKFCAKERFHRMTQEFTEFAKAIDAHDFGKTDEWMEESIAVARILNQARVSAGISFVR